MYQTSNRYYQAGGSYTNTHRSTGGNKGINRQSSYPSRYGDIRSKVKEQLNMNEEFEKIVDKRYSNKEELENVQYGGCTCCHSLFKTKLITEWIKEEHLYISDGKGNMKAITEGYTAKCPYCKEDNVIPLTNEYEQSKTLLKKIIDYEYQKSKNEVKE